MDVGGPQGQPDGKVNLFDFAALIKQGYILVVEGAIPAGSTGRFCYVGGNMTMLQAFDKFSEHADNILAVGPCAAFGGISAANPNLTNALSVEGALAWFGRTKPVINIPGCPMHPDWFVGTVVNLLAGSSVALDGNKRPTAYFGSTVHNNCPSLNLYNSNYAPEIGHAGTRSCLSCHSRGDGDIPNPRTLGMTGCLYALNCKGRQTYGDCATRKWNNPGAGQNGVNWCVGAGAPCHACTQPNFPDGVTPFYTLD
jgi:hydrogenase small subunit